MAPLPPNSTGRYFCDYQLNAHEHTAMVRANAIVSPATMGVQLDQLFTALTSMLPVITVTRLRWSPSGSTVSTPVLSGIEGNSYGFGTITQEAEPRFLDFVGRSPGGRRCRMAVFGYAGPLSDYRLTSAENTDVALALTTLQGGANSWLAIDGTKPVWYPYVDVGYNAYWQRKLRA